MQLYTEDVILAYVTNGAYHILFSFAGKSKNKMGDISDAKPCQITDRLIVNLKFIASIYYFSCIIIYSLETKLDPEEMSFIYFIQKFKDIVI